MIRCAKANNAGRRRAASVSMSEIYERTPLIRKREQCCNAQGTTTARANSADTLDPTRLRCATDELRCDLSFKRTPTPDLFALVALARGRYKSRRPRWNFADQGRSTMKHRPLVAVGCPTIRQHNFRAAELHRVHGGVGLGGGGICARPICKHTQHTQTRTHVRQSKDGRGDSAPKHSQTHVKFRTFPSSAWLQVELDLPVPRGAKTCTTMNKPAATLTQALTTTACPVTITRSSVETCKPS